MNSQNHDLLVQLGIPTIEEADDLELELNVRFSEFTPSDIEVWQRQCAYLHYFTETGYVTTSAHDAGVSVFTAQSWESRDTFGFNRRLEVAELEYCEKLEAMALEKATQPNTPVSLFIAILRARMPERYNPQKEKRDMSKDLTTLNNYRVNAHQQKAADHSSLQRIIQGDPDPFRTDPNREQAHANSQDVGLDDDPPLDQDEFAYFELSTHGDDTPNSDLSPAGGETKRGGPPHHTLVATEEEMSPLSNLSPTGDDTPNSDLSPAGGEIQRGGSPHHALAPTGKEMSPHSLKRDTYPTTHDSVGPTRSQNGPPQNREDLNRAARRQLHRQQRKQEKKNVFPVKRF